jgi:hypothetical protein
MRRLDGDVTAVDGGANGSVGAAQRKRGGRENT